MNARNKVFTLLGLLIVISFVWYFFTTKRITDLQLIGTVDANEVIVSSRIPGRIQTLSVDEGQHVEAGQIVAMIESQDLEAASKAAEAMAESSRYKMLGSRDTQRQTEGGTSSQITNAEAQLRMARASQAQAQAQFDRQASDTRRTLALADQGIDSEQARDQASTSLSAAKAAVDTARESVAASEASLKVATANAIQSQAAEKTSASAQAEVKNAEALLNQTQVELGYAKVISPVSGIVNTRAARQGEVVAAGTPIVTVVDLTQTWVYAPLPETQADAVQVGDTLRVEMPSGTSVQGKVISKAAEADFATQRDVSRRKRDIKTVRLKLLIDNPGMRYVPGMSAEVYIPRSKLVAQ
jgi:HlyD family secretion protein